MSEAGQPPEWEEHAHDALVHGHTHFHVTHNFDRIAHTFEHLSSRHTHQHDHAALTHTHWPHEDFDAEHDGEAHDHDHGEPVKKRSTRKVTTPADTPTAPRPRRAKKA